MSQERGASARGRRGWGRDRWRSRRGYYGGGGSVSSSYSSQRIAPIQPTLDTCPYPSWNLYLPDEVYSATSSAGKTVQAFKHYFDNHKSSYDNDEVRVKGACHLNYKLLVTDEVLLENLPDVATRIQEQPELILNCAALSLHTVLAENEDVVSTLSSQSAPLPFDVSRLYIRLTNYQPVLPLKVLKASQFGKCIAVCGTVVRTSNVKPLVTRMAFKCATCSNTQVVCLPDGKYALPSKCLSRSCNAKFFIPLRSSPLTETIDHQSIRIQEVINEDLREAGRIPRTMEVELTADLVDCCCPGDMVTITAIVKATGSDEGHSGRSSKDRCTFLLYLHAISVSNDKLLAGGDSSPASLHVEFSTKDYYAIEEIHGDKDVFKLIVGSLCPGIYGHEIVKAGLVLGLFGGSQDSKCTKNAVPVRGDPHILVVGDPGMGKSQMLQAAANTAPRGVYVCGNTSTAAGLTVTVTRDSSSNDYSLDAGALVLADQGCCCIDEFDKMGNQHQALLEAMEQQTISIAKAGIICSLPARTSILAAANPAGGHYNKAKTVSENLKMGSALLSRFDLVFILLDRPDEELDCLLSRHVMSLHSAPSASTSHSSSQVTSVTVRRNSSISITSSQSSVLWSADDIPLSERLKVLPSEGFDPVPNQLLRKYVAYARKYVKPSLSPEAAEVIQKFYLKLRQQRQGIDCTPITTRQLESLIRLTEARARLELRETATSRDAQDVVEIFKYSLYDAYSNEMGVVDFSRSQNGSGMASQSQVKRFVAELNKIAESTFNCLFTTQQMKDISKVVCLPDGKYVLPSKCLSRSCNAKFFIPLRSSPLTETIDHQSIRIQEVINEDLREAGRIPRTMEVELTADLVDCCCPGDMVTITAIVKATGSDEGHGGRSSKDRCTFLLYLHAISVSNDKLLAGGDSSPASIHVEFSTKDYYAIEEIHGDRDVFKLIVGSLCPGIYGHEIVKAGLVLGLFGGSQDSNCTKNAVPVRGDPHILIVGDPGMGKSQMLQAAANTAPRGVYVCGNTSTAAGLTVTVTRDSSSNDYSLDAGALVLADQGCCCIDEFDKMGNQHQALLEAMEQQTISIAKAGIICSLPARTSILAAANLAGGHYNKAKTVSENLKMGSALLSRFDLVFILLDRPDEELDCLLSRHVMSLHSAPSASTSHSSSQVTSVTVRRNSSISITSSQSSVLWSADDIPLSERLKVLPSEGFDPVPNQLLRKYVAYARKYVKPSLSPEAAEVIQKFYLKLRQQRQGIDCTPITTRQLESLIRLTEARARLELRETATSRDAQDVVEIFKYSLYDAYSNEMGVVDFSRSQNGSGMASQSQVKRFVAELNKIAESTFNCLFTTQQMKDISKRMGIRVACFEDFIGSLNCHGYLLKKGAKTYQLQTFS